MKKGKKRRKKNVGKRRKVKESLEKVPLWSDLLEPLLISALCFWPVIKISSIDYQQSNERAAPGVFARAQWQCTQRCGVNGGGVW